MKVEMTKPNQVKVMLETEDIAKYEIDISEIKRAGEKAKRVLKDAMEAARERTGFNPNNAHLQIEAYQEQEDYISIYITRLGEISPDPEPRDRCDALCVFGGADELLEAMGNPSVRALLGFMSGALYRLGEGYVLLFGAPFANFVLYSRLFLLLTEYGSVDAAGIGARLTLAEHGEAVMSFSGPDKVSASARN